MARALTSILACLPLLAACGGGSSAGGGVAAPPPSAPATVGVILTDAPVAGFDEALATVTRVELIGEPGRQQLFSGRQTVDLLRLRDYYELFAVSDGVEPGTYEKIRLQLDRLRLIRRDAAGAIVESIDADLVGNGKLDLNPRRDIEIAPADELVVTIDFDMEKSLKLTQTGSGRVILRPVVFVDISRRAPRGKLARLFGQIDARDVAAGAFRLCGQGLSSAASDERPAADGPPRCIDVATDAATGLFDADGEPIAFDDLQDGDPVTVVGRLRDADDPLVAAGGDPDYLPGVVLDALVVEGGPRGTFRRVAGTAESAVDTTTERFDLAVAPGQGFAGAPVIGTRVVDGTRVVSLAGDAFELLERDAIVAGRRLVADAVLALDGGPEGADELRAALIVLTDGPAGEEVLEGTLLTTDPLLVSTDLGDRCVELAPGADVFVADLSEDGLTTSRATADDLEEGQQVSLFGEESVGGCFVAETAIARAADSG